MAMPVYPTRSEYRLIPLQGYSLEEKGVISTAEDIAEREHDGRFRRDGHDEIDHPRAIASDAREARLSATGQALAWVHDVCEDGRNRLSPEQVGKEFGPVFGPVIAFGLDALTRRKGESDEEYYGRVGEAADVDIEILFDKMFDKRHFHRCDYGRPEDAEKNRAKRAKKARETLGPFRRICEAKRHRVPEWRLPLFDSLLAEIISLAEAQLN